MSHTDHVAQGFRGQFHSVSHYDSPGAVLGDVALSTAEKRVILSSWASDMYAVESNPALRQIPGIARPMRLNDILTALRTLDREDDDPPPRGGAVMPLPRPKVSLNAVARRHLSSPQPWLAAA
jgi:hypothetical protein